MAASGLRSRQRRSRAKNRAIERRALWAADDAARELPNLPLEDALQLVHLYAERGSPKYEKAAMRWLERYLTESPPRPHLDARARLPGRADGIPIRGRFSGCTCTPGLHERLARDVNDGTWG